MIIIFFITVQLIDRLHLTVPESEITATSAKVKWKLDIPLDLILSSKFTLQLFQRGRKNTHLTEIKSRKGSVTVNGLSPATVCHSVLKGTCKYPGEEEESTVRVKTEDFKTRGMVHTYTCRYNQVQPKTALPLLHSC